MAPATAGVCLALWLCRIPTAIGFEPPETGSVAPNQSISLIQADTTERAEPAPAARTEARQPTHEQEVAQHAGNGGTLDHADNPIRSRMLRRKDAETTFDRLQSDSTPWYRSGLGALAIVLVLMGTVFWGLRRFVPSIAASDGGVIKVVARTALTPKHNVALIRMGRRFLLVGMAGERIHTLAEVTEADEVAELVARVGGSQDFDRLLGREVESFDETWGKGTQDVTPEEMPVAVRPRRVSFHASALTQLKNRLRSLQSK